VAERVIVVGHNKGEGKVDCLELSVSDACAIRDTGMARATLSHYRGELANATVMHFTAEYLEFTRVHGAAVRELDTHEAAWKNLLTLPRSPKHESFEIDLRAGDGPRRRGRVR
jgi:hypothetical protein